PSAMVLSRQNMPTLCRDKFASAEGTAKGAYVLGDCEGTPDVILMGSGSELYMAVEAYDRLTAEGVAARVVSVPCMDLFVDQSAEYQESVLPKSCTRRVAVEAGIRQSWDRFLGFDGQFVGMSGYGASGPFAVVYEKFGITPDAVYNAAKSTLA
ncbi:MAG: transketolase C-terminal domain-containing protein, partial [Planctomycetota bacterium]